MRIIEEEQYDYEDLMFMPQRSPMNSRKEVNLYRDFVWVDSTGQTNKLNCIPVMVANMVGIGVPSVAKVVCPEGFICTMEKHCTIEELDNLMTWLSGLEAAHNVETGLYTRRVFPTVGIREDLSTLIQLSKKWNLGGVVIDVPNGYIPKLEDRVKDVVNICPHAMVIVGNVVTGDRTYDLLSIGATASKCGLGNGSMCATRKMTNVGRPQASAVMDCANAAHNIKKFIVADGGCKTVGHIATAFGLGADFVMLGGLFTGYNECGDPDQIMVRDGKTYKIFMGSSSTRAQNAKFGGMESHRASEGREVLVESKGPLINIVNDIKGGLRSTGTYIGASEIKHFSKHANFYKVRRTLNNMFDGNINLA